MATVNPQVGAINFTLRFNLKRSDGSVFDLTDYTAQVVLIDPKKVRRVVTGVITNPATTGQVTWTTLVASDLDKAGIWRVQVLLFKSLSEYPSQVGQFRVEPNL